MRIAVFVAAILLSACASVGTNYDPAVAMSLPVGLSEPEVIQRMGQPNNVTVLADGSRNLLWMHSTSACWEGWIGASWFGEYRVGRGMAVAVGSGPLQGMG